jgi:hypothetical protein
MRQPGRAAPFLWPDRNGLRRRWDRIESAVLIGLAALFLVAGPAAAIAAGRAADRAVLGQARGEQAWRRVTATLIRRDADDLQSASGRSMLLVRARWSAAAGAVRTGRVPVSPAQSKRGTAQVWVDAAGRLTGPPGALADRALEVSLAAASGALGLACVLFLAGAGARVLLDRRRMAGWETAWRAVGPQWSRRP